MRFLEQIHNTASSTRHYHHVYILAHRDIHEPGNHHQGLLNWYEPEGAPCIASYPGSPLARLFNFMSKDGAGDRAFWPGLVRFDHILDVVTN